MQRRRRKTPSVTRWSVELPAMTAAQLHDASVLIPGAYEPNAQPHGVAPARDRGPAATPYVVDAPARPKTRLGRAAAILGDAALITAIIFIVALAPVLVVQGINAVGALILGTSGGR